MCHAFAPECQTVSTSSDPQSGLQDITTSGIHIEKAVLPHYDVVITKACPLAGHLKSAFGVEDVDVATCTASLVAQQQSQTQVRTAARVLGLRHAGYCCGGGLRKRRTIDRLTQSSTCVHEKNGVAAHGPECATSKALDQ